MKSEFLMLAHTFKPGKHFIGGWFASEKIDGCRAFWDGGISRGVRANEVPYANTIKDSRLVDEPIATGLWSRGGKVIHAPDWWLNHLPNILLDGELFIDRGAFQELRKIIADHVPDEKAWEKVSYMVFDSPTKEEMFKGRDIKIRNDYQFAVDYNTYHWVKSREKGIRFAHKRWTYEHVYVYLRNQLLLNRVAYFLDQERLPLNHHQAIERVKDKLNNLLASGAEGVMLRNPVSRWVAERSHSLLKHKPWFTAEGVVVGYTFGVEGKTEQLLGKMGALILKLENGKLLKISGFTHAERDFGNQESRVEAKMFPGEVAGISIIHKTFPRGTTIEFKYRELSDDGVPKEARYFRRLN